MKANAVSEVIGYVVIVGIVFISIGMVYSNGIPALSQAEESQHLNNFERSFSVLKENIDEMVENEVEKRGSTMRLTDGTLDVDRDKEAEFLVTIRDNASSTVLLRDNSTSDPVIYSLNGRDVVYENGAVLRSDSTGSGMVTEPGWEVATTGDGATLINIVSVFGGSEGSSQLAGSGTALIRTDAVSGGENTYLNSECPCDINVTVLSNHSTAWSNYFEVEFGDMSGTSVSQSGNRVEFTITDTPRVIYTRTNIRMIIR